jgi:excisionase family DNA binding protein
MSQATETPLVDAEAVALRFRIHVRTVYRLARAEKIPSYRVGRQVRFDLGAVGAALRGGSR